MSADLLIRGGRILTMDPDLLSGAEERGGLLLDLPDGWYEVTRDAANTNVSQS